jgi:holo-[acyl-carrier protein] synthase
MIVGVGLDIVDIDEWEAEVNQAGLPWIERVFTVAERGHCGKHADPYRSFAGVLAAKEAALKALGKGWSNETDWQDVEIVHNAAKPTVSLKGSTLEVSRGLAVIRIVVSITHTKHSAAAVVILEG